MRPAGVTRRRALQLGAAGSLAVAGPLTGVRSASAQAGGRDAKPGTMIMRDRNHPSVVIWSLGNEIVEDANYAQRGQQMATLLRSLDQSRPVTLGGGSTFGAGDPSWQYVDIGDVHYNADGAGYGAIHDAHPDKPMTLLLAVRHDPGR
jgi:hypothetical protein